MQEAHSSSHNKDSNPNLQSQHAIKKITDIKIYQTSAGTLRGFSREMENGRIKCTILMCSSLLHQSSYHGCHCYSVIDQGQKQKIVLCC